MFVEQYEESVGRKKNYNFQGVHFYLQYEKQKLVWGAANLHIGNDYMFSIDLLVSQSWYALLSVFTSF
jgi:hypothetical protein